MNSSREETIIDVLRMLIENERLTPADIVAETGGLYDLLSAIKSMQTQGLITPGPNEHITMFYGFYLTETGRKCYEDHQERKKTT